MNNSVSLLPVEFVLAKKEQVKFKNREKIALLIASVCLAVFCVVLVSFISKKANIRSLNSQKTNYENEIVAMAQFDALNTQMVDNESKIEEVNKENLNFLDILYDIKSLIPAGVWIESYICSLPDITGDITVEMICGCNVLSQVSDMMTLLQTVDNVTNIRCEDSTDSGDYISFTLTVTIARS